jgi:hypothetical protein
VEQRSRVQAKVNFFACVKSLGYGEEVVCCLELTRKSQFPNATSLQTGDGDRDRGAVPGEAIFVKDRIVSVRTAKAEGSTGWVWSS